MQHTTKHRQDLHVTSGRWEPCTVFVTAGGGEEVCADCGWLHEEHPDHRK
jgi:hypothetical protein